MVYCRARGKVRIRSRDDRMHTLNGQGAFLIAARAISPRFVAGCGPRSCQLRGKPGSWLIPDSNAPMTVQIEEAGHGRDALQRLGRAGALTALIDFAFSSVLVTVFYHSTFAQLWQRVASALLGPAAMGAGTRTVLIGLAMHICVAFTWSAVFLMFYRASSWLRTTVESPTGLLAVAAVYGPCIWMVMSFIVVPFLTKRPPSVTFRWWVQFFGHIPFVALPIVTGIRGFRRFVPRFAVAR